MTYGFIVIPRSGCPRPAEGASRQSSTPFRADGVPPHPRSELASHRVARLLVELLRTREDVRLIDPLFPVFRADLFERDRHRLLTVVQHCRHGLRDLFRETVLLLVRLAGP